MNLKRIISLLISAALMMTTILTVYALDADNIEPWERSAETHRENLGSSIASSKLWTPRNTQPTA